jgi:hypothetical protein
MPVSLCETHFRFEWTMGEVLYGVEIGEGVQYELSKFSNEVRKYLEDPSGWKSRGYKFRMAKDGQKPRFVIILSSPKTLLANHCQDAGLSCAILNGGKVWINAMRWTSGSKASKQDLNGYRQYVISHEVGHALGFEHVKCPGKHSPAPIMMQQTLGIGQCTPNTKLTPADTKKA